VADDGLPPCAHAGEDSTWRYVWPAGERFLSEIASLVTVRGQRVIDLGCGRGRLGLWAAQAGATSVVFADHSAEALAAIPMSPATRRLEHRWGEELPTCDVLVGGDILYRPPAFADLIASVGSAIGITGTAYLVDPRRTLEPELPALAAAVGLEWSQERREAGYTLVRICRSADGMSPVDDQVKNASCWTSV